MKRTQPMMTHHLGVASTDDPFISKIASTSKFRSLDITKSYGPIRISVGGRVAEEDGHLLSKCFEAARCLHRLQPPDARTPCASPAPGASRALTMCISYIVCVCLWSQFL